MSKKLIYLYSNISNGEVENVCLLDTSNLNKVTLGLGRLIELESILDIDDDILKALKDANNNDYKTNYESLINRDLEDISVISTLEDNGVKIQLIVDKSSKCNVLRVRNNNDILDFNLGYSDYVSKSHKKYPNNIVKVFNKDLLNTTKIAGCIKIRNLLIVPRVHLKALTIPTDVNYLVLLEKAFSDVENLVLHNRIRNIFVSYGALKRNSIKNVYISYDTDLTLITGFLSNIAEQKHYADLSYGYSDDLDIIDKLYTAGIKINYI